MKKTVFFSLVAACALASNAAAQVFTDSVVIGGVTYTFPYSVAGSAGGEYAVIEPGVSPKPSGQFAVPPKLGGLPVGGIGERAFALADITELAIPPGVMSVGKLAFDSNQELKSVTIPCAVFDAAAFFACANIESVTITPGAASTVWNSTLFAGDLTLRKLDVVAGVTAIGANTFEGCEYLMELKLPRTITSVGARAFANCLNMWRVEVPCATINNNTFAGSDAIVEVTIVPGAHSTGWYETAFFNKPNLKRLVIGEGVTSFSYFRGCANLSEVLLPDSLETIGPEAFLNCTSLASITIPEGVRYIMT